MQPALWLVAIKSGAPGPMRAAPQCIAGRGVILESHLSFSFLLPDWTDATHRCISRPHTHTHTDVVFIYIWTVYSISCRSLWPLVVAASVVANLTVLKCLSEPSCLSVVEVSEHVSSPQ